jgi:hypothetical protein
MILLPFHRRPFSLSRQTRRQFLLMYLLYLLLGQFSGRNQNDEDQTAGLGGFDIYCVVDVYE